MLIRNPKALNTAHPAAVLQPLLALGSWFLVLDAVLRTDGSPALAAAARLIRIEHGAVNVSCGQRAQTIWHINVVNGFHSRLKSYLRRFNRLAPSYPHHYLDWYRTLPRFSQTLLKPASFVALAVGARCHHDSTRIAPHI